MWMISWCRKVSRITGAITQSGILLLKVLTQATRHPGHRSPSLRLWSESFIGLGSKYFWMLFTITLPKGMRWAQRCLFGALIIHPTTLFVDPRTRRAV